MYLLISGRGTEVKQYNGSLLRSPVGVLPWPGQGEGGILVKGIIRRPSLSREPDLSRCMRPSFAVLCLSLFLALSLSLSRLRSLEFSAGSSYATVRRAFITDRTMDRSLVASSVSARACYYHSSSPFPELHRRYIAASLSPFRVSDPRTSGIDLSEIPRDLTRETYK